MRHLYFVGQGDSSWRDARNWAYEEGGAPLRHLHATRNDHVIVCGVDGHECLDLRGMPHGALEIAGYTGRLRLPNGVRVSLALTRWARLRRRIRRELVPVVPPSFVAAVDMAGGWRRAVLDRLASLGITPRGAVLIPSLSGGVIVPAFRAVGTVVFPANSIPDPSTLAATAPAGRVVGDMLLCATWCRSITATVATPSGWSIVSGFPKRSGTASGASVYYFTRYADGTSADNCSPSWSGVTTGTSGDASGAVIIAYSNLSQTLDGTPSFAGHSPITTSTTVTGITLTTDNSMAISFALKLNEQSGQTSSIDSAYNERVDAQTTSGIGHAVNISDKVISDHTGGTGSPTVTWTNSNSSRDYEGMVAFLAATAVAPQTASLPYEATKGLAATATGPYESTKGIAQTSADPYETLTGLAKSGALPYEALRALAATGQLPFETLRALVATAQLPFEAIAGIAKAGALPYEALAALRLTALIPYETLVALALTGSLPFEALVGVAATAIDPYEALAALAEARQIPYSALGAITRSSELPYSTLAGISADATLDYETLAGVAFTKQMPFETLAGLVSALEANPYETLESLAAAAGIPYETLASAGNVAQTAVIPYETLVGIAHVADLPYETLQGTEFVSAFVVLPFETLGPGPVPPVLIGVTDGMIVAIVAADGSIRPTGVADGEVVGTASTDGSIQP